MAWRRPSVCCAAHCGWMLCSRLPAGGAGSANSAIPRSSTRCGGCCRRARTRPRSAWSGGWRRAGTWCASSPTCCASRTPRCAIPASCASRSNGRSSSPACRAAAPPFCTGCCWRIRTTARRWSGRRSIRIRQRRGRDARPARVARQLRAFERLAPEFRALHPLDATSPQECSEITAHVFRSLRFDTTYRIPSYRHWLDHAGHAPAYRFHRRFLQHLQHQAPGRPLGGEVPRPSVRTGCDPRRISRCPAGVRASRSGEGPAVRGQADRGGAAAVHAAAGSARDRQAGERRAGWRVRSG